MILSKEEFIKKHQDVILTGIVTESYIEDMLDMIEEGVKSDIKATRSQIRRIFTHMLKYQYQNDHQTRSWINTIRDANRNLQDQMKTDKNVYNVFGDDMLNDIYEDALRDAKNETGLPLKVFPLSRPNDFTKDNIVDSDFIEEFLKKYAYTDYAKQTLHLL